MNNDKRNLVLLEEIEKIEFRSTFGFMIIEEEDGLMPNILNFLIERTNPERLKKLGLTDSEKKLLDQRYSHKKLEEIRKSMGFGMIGIVCDSENPNH